MAVTQRTIADNAYEVKQLINLSNHSGAVTLDASGLANSDGAGDKLEIVRVEWSVDADVSITYTGTGTTNALIIAGGTAGKWDKGIIVNATDADITITPIAACYGYVYIEARKTTGFGN
jgi:hypothetical protein